MVIKRNKYLSSLKISIILEIVTRISCNTKIIIGYMRAYVEITCIKKDGKSINGSKLEVY